MGPRALGRWGRLDIVIHGSHKTEPRAWVQGGAWQGPHKKIDGKGKTVT